MKTGLTILLVNIEDPIVSALTETVTVRKYDKLGTQVNNNPSDIVQYTQCGILDLVSFKLFLQALKPI